VDAVAPLRLTGGAVEALRKTGFEQENIIRGIDAL